MNAHEAKGELMLSVKLGFHMFEEQMHLFSLVVFFRASVHPLRLINFQIFKSSMALIISLNVKNISAFETKMGVKCKKKGSDSMYFQCGNYFNNVLVAELGCCQLSLISSPITTVVWFLGLPFLYVS